MRKHLIASLVLLVVGVGAGLLTSTLAPSGLPAPPYKTLPQPPLDGLRAPSCTGGVNHYRGQCLPRPAKFQAFPCPLQLIAHAQCKAKLPTGIREIDLSNNDPIFGDSAWRNIYNFGYRVAAFKVNEAGYGYVDPTAKRMAASARRAGFIVTGYDFVHLCNGSGAAEGHAFAQLLSADGLAGAKTLPGNADVEFGNGACNGRRWMEDWYGAVKHDTGRDADTYTGAWFWQPNLGAYWHGGCCGGSRAWISGYGVPWPFMPSGRTKLDEWQDSDKLYNGVSHADASLWLDGQAALNAAANITPPPLPKCLAAKFPHTKTCYLVRYTYNAWQVDLAKIRREAKAAGCKQSGPPPACNGWRYWDGVRLQQLAQYRKLFL